MNKHFSVNQMGGDLELPIRFLDFESEEIWPGEIKETLEEVRQFARPIVIDLGEGSKNLVLTVDQVGQDGELMERRRLLITVGIGDDHLLRPNFTVLEKFLGIDRQGQTNGE